MIYRWHLAPDFRVNSNRWRTIGQKNKERAIKDTKNNQLRSSSRNDVTCANKYRAVFFFLTINVVFCGSAGEPIERRYDVWFYNGVSSL